MKYLMILALFVSPAALGKANCDVHRIYCAIVKLNPTINRAKAMKASNVLYKAAKHYKIDPMTSVGIIQQESGWDMGLAVVAHTNGAVDLGVAQINVKTAKDFGLSVPKLAVDPVYSLWAHAKILRHKVKVCRSKGWASGSEWSCYHSYSKNHRKRYERKAARWLVALRS